MCCIRCLRAVSGSRADSKIDPMSVLNLVVTSLDVGLAVEVSCVVSLASWRSNIGLRIGTCGTESRGRASWLLGLGDSRDIYLKSSSLHQATRCFRNVVQTERCSVSVTSHGRGNVVFLLICIFYVAEAPPVFQDSRAQM